MRGFFISPGRLAGLCYAIFAAFGAAVWYTLVFTAVPVGGTPSSTLGELLTLEPTAGWMQLHLAVTVVAAMLAAALLARPPSTGHAHVVVLALGLVLALVVWWYFTLDLLLLPILALLCNALGYRSASKQLNSDA